ncbi:MAG: phosphotransferase [Rhodospirillaceae bacterium]|nr:phosphotransferase [Rhodospirillaceae bacterium]
MTKAFATPDIDSDQFAVEVREYFRMPAETHWESVDAGQMNQTWCGAVAGHKKFVLRLYNAAQSLKSIEEEHHALTLLNEGFPVAVPKPRTGQDGRTVFTDGDKRFATFGYIPGQTPTVSSNVEAAQLGRLLAGCHKRLCASPQEFEWIRSSRLPLSDKPDPSPQFVLDQLEALDRAEAVDPILLNLDLIERVQTQARISRVAVSSQDDLQHLIHGDFNLSNLLYDSVAQSFTAVLDWDECRWDVPVYDVVGLLADMTDVGFKSIALQSYLDVLKGSDYSNAMEADAIRSLLPDASYARTYEELLIMLRTEAHEGVYVNHLVRTLAEPLQGTIS